MGLVLVLGFAAIAIGGLALLGLARPLWWLAGAALMLGAAGYALQGQPSLPASPARPLAAEQADDPTLLDLRDRMLGRYTGDAAYLVASDAMMRAGEQRAAVQVILGGISHFPQSLLLWTALGNALAAHDGGQLSPPALFAYQQAMRLSPEHPAPPFFLGLAHVREGDFAAARSYWLRALRLSPPNASYRGEIAMRLALLDQVIAMQTGAPGR